MNSIKNNYLIINNILYSFQSGCVTHLRRLNETIAKIYVSNQLNKYNYNSSIVLYEYRYFICNCINKI